MKDIIIVGAGAAGLTLAYYLCKAGLSVTVLEREKEVGGLARTFHYDDVWHFDIGPHRFYTANPLVLNFLHDIKSCDFLDIPRYSSVYFMGHYHKWPLRLKTVFNLPPYIAFRAGIDLLFKTWHRDPNNISFRNYTLQRYGKTLYEHFFHDYTEKFVGIPADQTHMDWAKVGVERATIDNTVNTASLMQIFKLMLMPLPNDLTFLYPRRGGIHTFWQLCAQQIRAMGGRVITGTQPRKLLSENGRVTKVITDQGEFDCEHLAWSAPINELNRLLGLPEVDLRYRSHLIYNVMLDAPPQQPFQWCYYGAKDLVFSRISNPANFSPETIPQQKGGLCIEVSCQEGDSLWTDPESLVKRITEEMVRVKIVSSAQQITGIRCERVPNAYPIYHLNYRQELERNDRGLSTWNNVRLLGRTGKFWYNNMDHSIENACSHARSLLQSLQDSSPEVASVIQALSVSPQ